MEDAYFDHHYHGVPVAQSAALRRFRATHSPAGGRFAGAHWTYLTKGHGPDTVLLLPGGLNQGEIYFPLIAALESRYQIIAPTYPPLDTMNQVVTGLLALLDAEQIPVAHVVGSSLGGMIAQCLVRRAPDRVASLVLATTGAPAPAFTRSLARRWRVLLALLPWLPASLIQRLNEWRFARLLTGAETDPIFWRAYFQEILARHTPQQWYTSSTRLLLDFIEHYAFAPGDLTGWPGRILILEADNDSEIAPPMRDALKAAYPQAMISTFYGAGHLALVTRAAEYLATVRSFLDRAAAQQAPAGVGRPATAATALNG